MVIVFAPQIKRASRTDAPPARRAAHAARPARVGLPRFLRKAAGHDTPHAPVEVSKPSDPSERAADRLAASVLRSAPCPACARGEKTCSACGGIQRKATDASPVASTAGAAPAEAGAAPVEAGGGRPLDALARAFFEPRFGRDLGDVRVHTGAEAAESARSLHARAYTYGNDIVFGDGQYAPGSAAGRRLLAHELAHVVEAPAGTVAREDLDASVPDAPEPMDAGTADTEGPRDASLPAGVPDVPEVPAGPPDLSPIYGPCADPAEQTARDAFALRTDMHLDRNVPSTTLGMFDTRYLPLVGLMPVVVKIKFDFVAADTAPGFWDWVSRTLQGEDLSRFYWTSAEETDYKTQLLARVSARWSARHVIRSTKPCWGFHAIPLVHIQEVDDSADAHFTYTVHKSPGPGIDYSSAAGIPGVVNNTYQSDVQESPDFRSTDVARSERVRLETALAATGASRVLFQKNSADVDATQRARLVAFASALKAKNPSDPAIPIGLSGWASAEGGTSRNLTLSLDRAMNVEAILRAEGVPQPLTSIGFGETGVPEDAANRRVDLEIDRTFETTYASNRYSVAEHEFGHSLGLPDEYANRTPATTTHANWVTYQTNYQALVTAAGMQQPIFGARTSGTMASGVDILPRYYLTFWEALGRMTTPDIQQNEWSVG